VEHGFTKKNSFTTLRAAIRLELYDMARFAIASRAGAAPVGFQPCSTAFSSRFCACAFAGVVAFALTPLGVLTRTFPFPTDFNLTGILTFHVGLSRANFPKSLRAALLYSRAASTAEPNSPR
jgi:hypothetical protein